MTERFIDKSLGGEEEDNQPEVMTVPETILLPSYETIVLFEGLKRNLGANVYGFLVYKTDSAGITTVERHLTADFPFPHGKN